MKLKAVVSSRAPEDLHEAFASQEFTALFMSQVLAECLGVENPHLRPAEFYVQRPDESVTIDDHLGVELRLTGVSRDGRKAALFHQALKALELLARQTIIQVLRDQGDSETEIQLFVVIMLDGDIETTPGSGIYSSVLENKACWVKAQQLEEQSSEEDECEDDPSDKCECEDDPSDKCECDDCDCDTTPPDVEELVDEDNEG